MEKLIKFKQEAESFINDLRVELSTKPLDSKEAPVMLMNSVEFLMKKLQTDEGMLCTRLRLDFNVNKTVVNLEADSNPIDGWHITGLTDVLSKIIIVFAATGVLVLSLDLLFNPGNSKFPWIVTWETSINEQP